jgi:CheY-like chemotaxis protein
VLLVEDDSAVRNATSELLEDEGFSVVTASDGRDALDLLRAGLRPAVIVLDVMMPRLDGWDFRHIQMADQRLKDIPVIVVSASGFSAEAIRSQFGGAQFIPKPIDPVDLVDAIVRACQPI